jgi:hypothetical protein
LFHNVGLTAASMFVAASAYSTTARQNDVTSPCAV